MHAKLRSTRIFIRFERLGFLQAFFDGAEHGCNSAGNRARHPLPLSFQQRKDARSKVAHHEQAKEGNGAILFAVKSVVNRKKEVAADKDLDVWHPLHAMTVALREHRFLVGFDSILWRAHK